MFFSEIEPIQPFDVIHVNNVQWTREYCFGSTPPHVDTPMYPFSKVCDTEDRVYKCRRDLELYQRGNNSLARYEQVTGLLYTDVVLSSHPVNGASTCAAFFRCPHPLEGDLLLCLSHHRRAVEHLQLTGKLIALEGKIRPVIQEDDWQMSAQKSRRD
jgi:hypothetical protein